MKEYLKRPCLLGLLSLLCTAPVALAQGGPPYPAVGPEPGAPALYAPRPAGVQEIAPGVKAVINPSELPKAGGIIVGGPLGGPQGHHPQGEQCVPTQTTRTKTRIEYGSVDIDYCLTKCGPHGCAGDCKDGSCGKPRRKHFLMKRVVTTECPVTQCTPVCNERPLSCVPACQAAATLSPSMQAPAAASPPTSGVPSRQTGVPTTLLSGPQSGVPLTYPVTTQGMAPGNGLVSYANPR